MSELLFFIGGPVVGAVFAVGLMRDTVKKMEEMKAWFEYYERKHK